MTANGTPSWYHVTTLSNFVKGYDKYTRQYAKTNIPQSTFPDQFFLLAEDELPIGIAKATRLLEKLNLPGDRLVALQTSVPDDQLRRDHASGLGQYIPQNRIDLEALHYIENGQLVPVVLEEAVAHGYEVIAEKILPWDQLTPRTVSVLPIAEACQASCKFCFSKASVSSDFEGQIKDWDRVSSVLRAAKLAGAERGVITGGGEPTLLKHDHLTKLVRSCAAEFNKVVLITNGHIIARLPEGERLKRLTDLDRAGLTVLSISRHHHDADRNTEIMQIDTQTEQLMDTLRAHRDQVPHITPRFICVLQDDGIATVQDIEDYLSWSLQQGVREVNFKELYVSATTESVYSDWEANAYSAEHQVPLRVVHDFVDKHGWEKVAELPWGAPIFRGMWNGQVMKIAAYTEPSVYWERTNGIARSWNIMTDGTVLASLEDPMSKVAPR